MVGFAFSVAFSIFAGKFRTAGKNALCTSHVGKLCELLEYKMPSFILPKYKVLSSVQAFFVVCYECCLFLLEAAPVLAQMSPNSPGTQRTYDAQLQGFNAILPAEHGAYWMILLLAA